MARSSREMSTWHGRPLSRRSVLLGLGAVGAFLVADLGAVAVANRWIGGSNALTSEMFLDRFRAVFGLHPGFRRNHAKGVAVTGHFDSNGNGSELSRAAVFRPGQTPVIGRFSGSGGDPAVADGDPPAAPRAGAHRGVRENEERLRMATGSPRARSAFPVRLTFAPLTARWSRRIP